MNPETPSPLDPTDHEQFIEAFIAQKRAEADRIKTMPLEALWADEEARAEAGWRQRAELAWKIREAQLMTQQRPPALPARPAFSLGASVPPDVESRLGSQEHLAENLRLGMMAG